MKTFFESTIINAAAAVAKIARRLTQSLADDRPLKAVEAVEAFLAGLGTKADVEVAAAGASAAAIDARAAARRSWKASEGIGHLNDGPAVAALHAAHAADDAALASDAAASAASAAVAANEGRLFSFARAAESVAEVSLRFERSAAYAVASAAESAARNATMAYWRSLGGHDEAAMAAAMAAANASCRLAVAAREAAKKKTAQDVLRDAM